MAVQYAFVSANGEVQHVMSMGADSDYVDGQVYNGLTAKAVATAADAQDLMNTKYFSDGQWLDRQARVNQWQDWVDNAWTFNAERFWVHVRHERDLKLGQSDWTQMSDVNFNAGVKTAWITYRQALRNVPNDNADCISINDIVWPLPPS